VDTIAARHHLSTILAQGGSMHDWIGRRVAMRMGVVVATAALIGVAACSLHNAAVTPIADENVITQAEIDSSHAFNAYEAVHKLRPRFLISRGKLSLDPTVAPALPNVYVDQQYYGDASTLRGISTSVIESIHYYSPAEAQYAFGRGNMAGVIGVNTKH
jgi:hypothetical protein